MTRMRRYSTRRGYTLMEMAVSVAVTGVLMVGIGSAILIAGFAMRSDQSESGSLVTGAVVLSEMTTELQYATSFDTLTATEVQFAIPDRNGDDVPEVVHYQWSGVPGDPLLRTYNGGSPVEVLTDVHEFQLTYDMDVVTHEAGSETEGAEKRLISHHSTEYLADFVVRDSDWVGQYICPDTPMDAVSWKVTKVNFNAKRSGAAFGQAMAQLRLATTGGFPSGIVLEEHLLDESTLTDSYASQEFLFSNVTGFTPGRGLCIVIMHISDAEACSIRIDSNYSSSRSHMVQTTNGGSTWFAPAGESMIFDVYGTITSTGTPQPVETSYVESVRVKLRAGDLPGGVVSGSVRALNEPEVVTE